jgi:hypothetical protein
MMSPVRRNATTVTGEAEKANPLKIRRRRAVARPRLDGSSAEPEAPAPRKSRTEADLALATRPRLVDKGDGRPPSNPSSTFTSLESQYGNQDVMIEMTVDE